MANKKYTILKNLITGEKIKGLMSDYYIKKITSHGAWELTQIENENNN